MLSLRAFARSAPRTASRIASYSTRTSFIRPALQTSTIRSQRLPQQLPRCFSTTFPRYDDAAQELAAKLNQEIQLETEENSSGADSDANVSNFKNQFPEWNIVDEDGNQEVLLTRQYEDETITVSFSIADFNNPAMMDGAQQGEEMDDAMLDEEDGELETPQSGGANTKGAINQGRTKGGNIKVAPEDEIAPADRDELRNPEDEGESGDEGQSFPAGVNVLVERKNKGALRISLVAADGVFSIQSVTHLPDSKQTNGKSASELIRDTPETLYTGPPFQQLDEEVQSLLEQYLDVRGINTALALFVPEYIDVKEQKEYINWLGRVREFVE